MSWAQRLKRVFGIEIDTCARCNGKLKIIASIEEPAVIARILAHLERIAPEQYPIGLTLVARSAGGLFGVLVIFGIEVEVEPPD